MLVLHYGNPPTLCIWTFPHKRVSMTNHRLPLANSGATNSGGQCPICRVASLPLAVCVSLSLFIAFFLRPLTKTALVWRAMNWKHVRRVARRSWSCPRCLLRHTRTDDARSALTFTGPIGERCAIAAFERLNLKLERPPPLILSRFFCLVVLFYFNSLLARLHGLSSKLSFLLHIFGLDPLSWR